MKLILEAQVIPDGSTVYKATGTKPFILRKHGVKLFTEDGQKVLQPNSYILQSEDSLLLIQPTLELALQFDTIAEVHAFVDKLHAAVT